MSEIADLSKNLLENGVIKRALTAVIRKGREHYACERNLRTQMQFERDEATRRALETILEPSGQIDLAEIDGLNPYIKRRIAVPSHCDKSCPYRDSCPYLWFRRKAQAPSIDIQICNHNYLLADTLRRAHGEKPLIPNYQMIIVDESHKFIAAARSMYGIGMSSRSIQDINRTVLDIRFERGQSEKEARNLVKLLSSENNRLFKLLTNKAKSGNHHEDASRLPMKIDKDISHYVRKIQDLSGELIDVLSGGDAIGTGSGRKRSAMWELEQVRNQAASFRNNAKLICWYESDENEKRFCAIPQNLDERLHKDLWNSGVPVVLTSGTLSAGGDFSHMKRSLGLHYCGGLVTETSKPSPFDYRKNALLYINDFMPFPEKNDDKYLSALTKEIEKLIRVSNGHAAVLFTSYNAMGRVYRKLQDRGMPFPMFRLDKGSVSEVERFKQSCNGVLFASGVVWEGIDIPGDALSMLIIVKLPFAVPDPISDYERTLYDSVDDYKARVVTPEMLVKLKQGFGRLIRTEHDSGCVALLDSRAGIFGKYRIKVLNALPNCRVTNKIQDVEAFLHEVKSPAFFR
jgi:ATP-dependent DNA helicase DinG